MSRFEPQKGERGVARYLAVVVLDITTTTTTTTDKMMNMNQQEQWRVVFYEVDEEPIEEIMSSFADAWALAQPDPQHERGWRIQRRADVIAAFAAGEQDMIVAHHPNGVGYGRTVISRV